jgi:hypothetical protein
LTPTSPPRGLIVVFGGFDSYIEEWLPMLLALRDAGPGRGRFRRTGPGHGLGLPGLALEVILGWLEQFGG